jgi:hypothetical protein
VNITSKFSAIIKRLHSIKSDPEVTPEKWCELQPCINITIGPKEHLLTQPSSSAIVYLLGIITIAIGSYFIQIKGSSTAFLWWGIALLLWGVGTLLAGTSYQAFGYQIKCKGRKICSWTSWWEVVYLILQQLSVDAMLAAVVFSCTTGKWRLFLICLALIWAAGYTILVLIGALLPVKKLITFELMVWISSPIILILIILNSWRYLQLQNPLDLFLLIAWLFLLIVLTAYWIYDKLDITTRLWAKGDGIWFSQNDLLHIGLVLWMFYLSIVVTQYISNNTVIQAARNPIFL